MEDEENERSYSIWGFAALFIALLALGGWAVLTYGTHDREPTEVLPDSPASTTPDATTTTAAVPATLLDGSPAPEAVSDVVSAPGQHTYVFELPADMLSEPTETVVPPAILSISEDERFLTVSMGCAVSEGSVPDALRVTEDPFQINVTPVVTGLSFGRPCASESVAGEITIALEEPVGTRRVVLSRAGDNVQLGTLR